MAQVFDDFGGCGWACRLKVTILHLGEASSAPWTVKAPKQFTIWGVQGSGPKCYNYALRLSVAQVYEYPVDVLRLSLYVFPDGLTALLHGSIVVWEIRVSDDLLRLFEPFVLRSLEMVGSFKDGVFVRGRYARLQDYSDDSLLVKKVVALADGGFECQLNPYASRVVYP
ncbi:unnamed protein product [Symbiodinium microadriaticum]|nr:unnamed protein product [Symbiodinium microadriaticum]CAE7938951.1 unnamed protein product [Symbiodinium sp. KB8]